MIFHLIDNLSMNRREEEKNKEKMYPEQRETTSREYDYLVAHKNQYTSNPIEKITRQTVKCERVIKNPNFSK